MDGKVQGGRLEGPPPASEGVAAPGGCLQPPQGTARTALSSRKGKYIIV